MSPLAGGRGRYGATPLALAAIVFVITAPVFWRQVELRGADVAQAHENAALYQRIYPSAHYGFTRLARGELPLWNSSQACGTAFLADPSNGLFQPLNALFLRLPATRAMAVHAYVTLALSGFLFILFARSLNIGYLAALFGGLTYAYSGVAASAMSHPDSAAAMAWAPLVLWGTSEFARRGRMSCSILSGLGGALMLLCGAWPIAIAVFILCAAYWTIWSFPPSQHEISFGRRATGLALAALTALGISAIQWWPTLAWLTTLEAPWNVLCRMDLAGLPASGWRGVLGHLLGAKAGSLPHLGYVGMAPLVALPAALFTKRARRDLVFFLVAAPALLFAAGHDTFPLSFPPQAWAIPGTLGLAALGSMGLDRLLHATRGRHAPSLGAPALCTVICALTLVYVSSSEARGRIIVFLALLVPFILFRTRPVAAFCGILAAAFLFIDLTLASANRYQHPFLDAPECYMRQASSISAAQEHTPDGRIFVSSHELDNALPANLGMIFPVQTVGGRAARTHEQATLWKRIERDDPAAAMSSPLLDLMGMQTVIVSPEGPLYAENWAAQDDAVREVRLEGDVRLFVNNEAFPRAYYVSQWQRAESAEEAFDMLTSPDFDMRQTCVIQTGHPAVDALKALVPESREPVPSKNQTVCELDEITPEHIVVHLETASPGVTVITDTFDRGWKATLDGIPWPILRANGAFRGIATPAGKHEIVLRYDPVSLRLGQSLSLATLAALLGLGLVSLGRSQ